MSKTCKKNKPWYELVLEFGRGDDLGECKSCPNLVYTNGTMECNYINEINDELTKSPLVEKVVIDNPESITYKPELLDRDLSGFVVDIQIKRK